MAPALQNHTDLSTSAVCERLSQTKKSETPRWGRPHHPGDLDTHPVLRRQIFGEQPRIVRRNEALGGAKAIGDSIIHYRAIGAPAAS